MVEKPDVTGLVLSLLKEPTERDKQVKVGASNFSQPCPRCLAEQLLGTRGEGERYAWAGAVIGTAIHNLLEQRVKQLHPTWLPERKLVLGELPGYGTVKSTSDLYVREHQLVVDYKSTTRTKLGFIKRAVKDAPNEYEVTAVAEARYKVNSYLSQVMSYGRGMILAGYPVTWVSLAFVCRDAVGDKDVWSYTVEYDAEHAERVWDRLARLWEALQGGLDPATLDSAPGCYYCENIREA